MLPVILVDVTAHLRCELAREVYLDAVLEERRDELLVDSGADGRGEDVDHDGRTRKDDVEGLAEGVYLRSFGGELLGFRRGWIAGRDADGGECLTVLGQEEVADMVSYREAICSQTRQETARKRSLTQLSGSPQDDHGGLKIRVRCRHAGADCVRVVGE